MKSIAKLIHKTHTTYLPTAFPAHYYGMPDGKIYLIYSRFYEIKFGESGLEFVFAVHKEFSYDYETEIIIPSIKIGRRVPVFAENVDIPDPKINIIKIIRSLNSYGEALALLNKEVTGMKRPA
ncbi:MAG: hypothetical protein GQ525_08420 [Draconibacterium sp.]|nr:hypothetical protein [Draconibacterium sp.]